MRKEIDYWFEQAKADLKSATDLLKTENFYASVFFSQQTSDYITTRYPDAANGAPFESYTRESAERHLRMAKEVLQWVETMLLMK
ncbi:MAG: HEPN domain-containing protein [Candidatus Methanoperedens sp.]|nr:HEPN domain-containing protein [Candidatus Methanoperedens sp.]